MHFEIGKLYHVYNQGNDRQRIFFSNSNYLFFKLKMQLYILPFADILAWCLMPNHFHMLIYIRHTTKVIHGAYHIRNQKARFKHEIPVVRSINESIAILLRSYTRAINKEQTRSGSIFRSHTKASALDDIKMFPNWLSYFSLQNIQRPTSYPKVCFNYIHQNPVSSKLVDTPTQWPYSSAQAYELNKKCTITKTLRAKELGLC